jgi:hypothetical protein
VAQTYNNQLQRTVERYRGRAAAELRQFSGGALSVVAGHGNIAVFSID